MTRPTKRVAKPSPTMRTIRAAHSSSGPGLAEQGTDARQRGDDRVRSAVEHHRHGHDADGKHDRGEDAADCEVGEEEVEMIGTDHLAEEVLQRRHAAREEQGERHQRSARPDEGDDGEPQREQAEGPEVGAPRGQGLAAAITSLATLPAPADVVEPGREKGSDEQETGGQRRGQFDRVLEHEMDQPAHQRERDAVEQAGASAPRAGPCQPSASQSKGAAKDTVRIGGKGELAMMTCAWMVGGADTRIPGSVQAILAEPALDSLVATHHRKVKFLPC